MNTPTENNAQLPSDNAGPAFSMDTYNTETPAPPLSEESAAANLNEPQGEPDLDGVVDIEFLDLTLAPIADLKYRLEFNGEHVSGKTDAKGHAQRLTDITAGTLVDIYVYRDHHKDYKKVGAICGSGGECGYSIVSPKLRFALDTEPHEGAPGKAEENKPLIPPILVNTTAGVPAGLPPAKPPTPGTSAATPPATKIEKGRDSKGNPLLTIIPTVFDNLYKAVLPFLHLWGWQSTGNTATPADQSKTTANTTQSKTTPKARELEKNKKAATHTTAVPHQAINPAVTLSQAPGTPLSPANKQRLDALFAYAEAQVLINYKEYQGGTVSEKILGAILSNPPKKSPGKAASKSMGMCFAYVRVALHQNRFVNATSGNGQAHLAGIDLAKEKYQEVSASLPTISIHYPSGNSEKQQTKIDSSKTQRAAIETKAKQEKWSAEQKKDALEKLGARPEPEGIDITQTDLMYTLPGDIIVYKQVVPYEPNAAGHIDIRTYHGFVSDFAWGIVPKLGGVRTGGKQYAVIGVYRKVSDEMAMVRVKAFLRIIREHEAKGFSEPYHALKWEGRKQISFSDLSTHPSNREKNEPAGAYQIKWSTWDDVTRKLIGWPPNFVPETQERIALYLLQRRPNKDMPHPRRSALGYIMEGKIEDAVNQTGLPNEWSFLPGGKGQQIDMNKLKTLFDQYVQGHPK